MKPTILIADDDREIVESIKEYLELQGFDTLFAFEGIRALEQARKNRPNLIILDIQMPTGTGIRVLEDLAKLDTTKNIPVIVLTGLDDSKIEERARQLGVKEYMRKPCNLEVLTLKINFLLGLSPLE